MTNFQNFKGILSSRNEFKNAAASTASNQTVSAPAQPVAQPTPAPDPAPSPIQVQTQKAASLRERLAQKRAAISQMKESAEVVVPEAEEPQPIKTAAQPIAAAPQPTPQPQQPQAQPQPSRRYYPRRSAAAPAATPTATRSKAKAPTKPAQPKVVQPIDTSELKFQLVDYSEKSFIVWGDTKPMKDTLKQLGGRYNPSLHPFGCEQAVAGWVFPTRYKEKVVNAIGKGL